VAQKLDSESKEDNFNGFKTLEIIFFNFSSQGKISILVLKEKKKANVYNHGCKHLPACKNICIKLPPTKEIAQNIAQCLL